MPCSDCFKHSPLHNQHSAPIASRLPLQAIARRPLLATAITLQFLSFTAYKHSTTILPHGDVKRHVRANRARGSQKKLQCNTRTSRHAGAPNVTVSGPSSASHASCTQHTTRTAVVGCSLMWQLTTTLLSTARPTPRFLSDAEDKMRWMMR